MPEQESALSAQVVLWPRDHSVDVDEPITSQNLARHLPDPSVAETVRRALAERGFEVGPLVGIGFSITAPRAVFRAAFGPAAERAEERARQAQPETQEGIGLDVDALSPSFSRHVRAVEAHPATRLRTRGAVTLVDQRRGPVGEHLVHGPLVAAGGFVVTQLAPDHQIEALRREAVACYRRAQACRMPEPPAGPEAPGQPDRWLDVAIGGDVLRTFFHAPAVLDRLEALTSTAWRPHGAEGTYSYYRAAGHYLGVHRDAVGCDLAVITCLADTGSDDSGGGELVVYPGAAARSLASVRADTGRDAHVVRLRVGESAILVGSVVPHRVAPVRPGQVRVVAPLCYQSHL